MSKRMDLASLVTAPPPAGTDAPPPPKIGTATRPVPIEQIAANPRNTRRLHRSPDKISELAASMARFGQMQSCTVVTRRAFLVIFPELAGEISGADYVQVTGGRRRLAAMQAGLSTLDVSVKDAIAATRADFVAATAVENIEREDLDPIEEAEALQEMATELDGNQSAVATKMGRTRQWVSQRIGLLRLVAPLQELVRSGEMPIAAARHVAAQDSDRQLDTWQVLQRQRSGDLDGAPQAGGSDSGTEPDPPAPGPPAPDANRAERVAPAVKAIRRLGDTPQDMGEALVKHMERQQLLELWTFLKTRLEL